MRPCCPKRRRPWSFKSSGPRAPTAVWNSPQISKNNWMARSSNCPGTLHNDIIGDKAIMKTWKYALAALILAVSMTAAPQHTPKSPVQRMVDQLDLSADQKAKIDPILEDDAKQVR